MVPSRDERLLERRSSVRRTVCYRMDVTDEQGALFGCVVDLSSAGLRLRGSETLDLTETRELFVELPRWLGLGPRLALPGRFVWCKMLPESGELEAGYAFGELTARGHRLLGSLLARLSDAAEADAPPRPRG